MLIRKHGHSLLFRQYSTVTNKLHRWVLVRNFNGAFGAIQWRWLYIFQKCVEKLGILFICFQKAQLAIAHSANLILSDQPRHFPRLNLIKFKNWFLLDLVIRQLNKHDLYGCRICLFKKKNFVEGLKQFLPLGQTPVATVLIKRMLIVEGYLLGPVTLVAIVFYPFLLLLPSLSLSLSFGSLLFTRSLSPSPSFYFSPHNFSLSLFMFVVWSCFYIFPESAAINTMAREGRRERAALLSLSLPLTDE